MRCAELDPVAACHLLVELALVVGVVGEFLGGHACAVFLWEGVGFELASVGIEQEAHLGLRLGFLIAPLEERHDLLPDGIGDFGSSPSHRRRGFHDRRGRWHMADEAVAEVAEFVEGFVVGYEFHLWWVRLILRCGLGVRGGVGLRYCVGGVGGGAGEGSSLSGGGGPLRDCHAATSQITPMARRSGAAPMKKDAMKKMQKTARFFIRRPRPHRLRRVRRSSPRPAP